MAAFTFLATKRLNRENHTTLGLLTLAQSGDDKAIKKQFEDWEKDA
jgi:hypothetical protein